MQTKLRIGLCALMLAGLFLPFAIAEIIAWVLGTRSNVAWFIVLLISLIAVVAWRRTPSKIQRRVAVWFDDLERRPIPRFTVARVIVVFGVVGSACWCFIWLTDNEKFYDPVSVLLIVAVIVSFNFLENRWVAIDRRQGRTPRPNRSRFV